MEVKRLSQLRTYDLSDKKEIVSNDSEEEMLWSNFEEKRKCFIQAID